MCLLLPARADDMAITSVTHCIEASLRLSTWHASTDAKLIVN